MIYNWFIKLFDTNRDGSVQWGEIISLIYTIYMGIIVIGSVTGHPPTPWLIAFTSLGSLGHAAIEMARAMSSVKDLPGQKYNSDDHTVNIEE